MQPAGSCCKQSTFCEPQGDTQLAEINVANRTLFIADNLPVLRGINSESIDLIATDPPFNKGVRAFEGITKAGETVSYKDVWTWGDVQQEWVEKIKEDHPALHSAIQLANVTAGDDMGAFLCWLAVRVLECHRILKPTGNMYLHIDHTAHAYVKAMMDAIFGRQNFRNEIVWCYGGRGMSKRWFNRKHDTILLYVKDTKAAFFDPKGAGRPVAEEHTARYDKVDEDGRRYARILNRDGTYSNIYLKDSVVMEDWWVIPYARGKEATGYPTQKPIALYERMIKASSKEGGTVLDPFAGCATTCVAAERLGRQWIGIDINEEAKSVIRDRLQSEVKGSLAWKTLVKTPKKTPKRTDDGEEAAPELTLTAVTSKAPRLTARELRERLVLQDGLKCQGCGWIPHHADYLENDHNVPKAHGGRDDIRNRVLLCAPCNGVKSKKLTLAELRERRIDEGRMMDTAWNKEWYEKVGRHGAPA